MSTEVVAKFHAFICLVTVMYKKLSYWSDQRDRRREKKERDKERKKNKQFRARLEPVIPGLKRAVV